MSEKNCGACKFFDRIDNSTGLCRLMPPVVIPAVHERGGERQTKPFTTWPLVRPRDWCGDWTTREGPRK